MKDKIANIALIVMIIIIIIVGIAVIKVELFPQTETSSPNLYLYTCPENGTCYYITSTGYICPIYNSDGTIYTISENKTD